MPERTIPSNVPVPPILAMPTEVHKVSALSQVICRSRLQPSPTSAVHYTSRIRER
jgi:hypothetical protein